MARHLLLVTSNPLPGREDEFHSWYDDVHLPEVLAIPGVIGAERFDLSRPSGLGSPSHRFAAVYELDCDDPQRVLDAIGEAAAAGRIRPGDAAAPDMELSFLASRGPARRG